MESTPLSWFLLQKEMKNSGKVELTMAEVEKMFKEVQKTSTLDVKNDEMETIKHLSKLFSEPGVKNIQWAESTVTDITHDQKDSQKLQHSQLKNEETVDLEESEVETSEDEDIAKMTADQPENHDIEMKEHKPIKQVTEAESIVEFYASIGDVLHFPKFEDLKNKVIVKPMELVGDCR